MHPPQVLIFLLALSQYGVFFSWSNDSFPKHYCGSSLTDALSSVCKKRGFATHFAPRAESNRTTRGIIEECCNNPCSKDQLSQYCQKKIAKIPISKRRYRDKEQSFHFIETNKVSKRKRSPTSVCTCGNRSSHKRNQRRNRKRSTKLQNRKRQLMHFAAVNNVTYPTTTDKQFTAEAQYIDDWTGEEGGPPVFLNAH